MHEHRTDMTLADAQERGWAMTITCRACNHVRPYTRAEFDALPGHLTFAEYAARLVCKCGAKDPIMGMMQGTNPTGAGAWVPELRR